MQVYQMLSFSPLENLPTELLDNILRRLSLEDQLKIRLVSRILARAAAPFSFQTIPLWLGVESLERLTALSEHLRLSQYVRKIVVSPIRFVEVARRAAHLKIAYDRHLDTLQYARTVYRPTLEYMISVIGRAIADLDAWQSGLDSPNASFGTCSWLETRAYGEYVASQNCLEHNCQGTDILTKALRRFSHLKVIDIDYHNDRIGSGELLRVFGEGCSAPTCSSYGDPDTKRMLVRDTEHTAFVLFQALRGSYTKLEVLHLGENDDFFGRESRYLPQSFFSDDGSDCTGNKIRCLPAPQCDSIFSELRELRIGSKGFLRSGYTSTLMQSHDTIRYILCSAPMLETVKIEELDARIDKPLSSLFEGLTLCRLRHFEVSGTPISPAALLDFFLRHRSTLVMTHVSHIYKQYEDDDEDWEDEEYGEELWSPFLRRLRCFDFPCLSVFTITECNQQEDGVEVQEYVLRLTDIEPLAQAREMALQDERQRKEDERGIGYRLSSLMCVEARSS